MDPEKINAAIDEALSDRKVAEDFNNAMLSAARKVPGFNPDQTLGELREMITRDGFQTHRKVVAKIAPEKRTLNSSSFFHPIETEPTSGILTMPITGIVRALWHR